MRLSKTCRVSFCQNSPLKIRGGKESYGYGNNPFIPLTLRERFKERALILRGILKERPLGC
jgi:hypothetical protein